MKKKNQINDEIMKLEIATERNLHAKRIKFRSTLCDQMKKKRNSNGQQIKIEM